MLLFFWQPNQRLPKNLSFTSELKCIYFSFYFEFTDFYFRLLLQTFEATVACRPPYQITGRLCQPNCQDSLKSRISMVNTSDEFSAKSSGEFNTGNSNANRRRSCIAGHFSSFQLFFVKYTFLHPFPRPGLR